MAINFPTSLDNFTNPSSGNTLDSPSHSLQHSDINDAVEALQAKVGIGASPAGSATSGQVLTAQGGGTALWATPDSGGLVLINTTSFSAVDSQSINDVFSATYDKYLLQWNFAASGNINVLFRFRVSGSDDSTSNYYYAGMSNGWSAGSTAYYNAGSGQTSWLMIPTGGSGDTNGSYVISDPFTAKKAHTFGNWSRANGGDISITGNVFDATTSFTGFSLITSTGTITGSVSVYGYNK